MKSAIKIVIGSVVALLALVAIWPFVSPHRYPAMRTAKLAFQGPKQSGGYAKAAVLRANGDQGARILVLGECTLAEGDAPLDVTTQLSIRSHHQQMPIIVTEYSDRLEKIGTGVQSGPSRLTPATCLADECVIEVACESSRQVTSRFDLLLQVTVMYDIETRHPPPITLQWANGEASKP